MDDAGVFRLRDDLALVQTADFITPLVDDPRLFGRIAGANSLSDIYAMGARPITALNLCGFPEKGVPPEALREILAGGLDALAEAGAFLLGGHSVTDAELKYGMAVTGVVDPARVVTIAGARAGDALLLTKPIGTGIIASAFKMGKCDAETLARAARGMARLNRSACEAMLRFETHAATDVTGFGFLLHALQIARGSRVALEISAAAVPRHREAAALAKKGATTCVTPDNEALARRSCEVRARLAPEEFEVLSDPQTSGGLLIAVAERDAEALLAAVRAGGDEEAAIVGRVLAEPAGKIVLAP